MELFNNSTTDTPGTSAPLAERMRPGRLEDLVGQDHVTGPGSLLGRAVEEDRLFSVIFWGPPGCGKTTLARILASETVSHFEQFSAVGSGVKEIRAVVEKARDVRSFHKKKTIVFVDEIHRFNKAQQDAFLPHVESGLITLVGATTENPSFEVIAPLLSRCRVVTLNPLSEQSLQTLAQRALKDREKGLGIFEAQLSSQALDILAAGADGDARVALNVLEVAVFLARPDESGARQVTQDHMTQALQKKTFVYDKSGEQHYNLISALHKSLRDSDPDGALYWLGRMLNAGEDPLYLGRRMVRFASEDVGNAAPQALVISMNAVEAFRFLGSPEGELALYQAAAYLATCPKSNAVYVAQKKVRAAIEATGSLDVPKHIRNAPTKLMKDLGYGKGYQYAHDHPDAVVDQQHLPDRLKNEVFYEPTDRGYEKTIRERLFEWKKKTK